MLKSFYTLTFNPKTNKYQRRYFTGEGIEQEVIDKIMDIIKKGVNKLKKYKAKNYHIVHLEDDGWHSYKTFRKIKGEEVVNSLNNATGYTKYTLKEV